MHDQNRLSIDVQTACAVSAQTKYLAHAMMALVTNSLDDHAEELEDYNKEHIAAMIVGSDQFTIG